MRPKSVPGVFALGLRARTLPGGVVDLVVRGRTLGVDDGFVAVSVDDFEESFVVASRDCERSKWPEVEGISKMHVS